jgi:hypothetical protein
VSPPTSDHVVCVSVRLSLNIACTGISCTDRLIRLHPSLHPVLLLHVHRLAGCRIDRIVSPVKEPEDTTCETGAADDIP